MTNEELRLAIAKAKGIQFHVSDGGEWIQGGYRMHREYTDKGDLIGKFYYEDDGQPYYDLCPNWPTSIADAWELVEEMARGVDVVVSVSVHNGKSSASFGKGNWFRLSSNHDTAPRAICESYLAWKAAK